jgi:hypothetical protein
VALSIYYWDTTLGSFAIRAGGGRFAPRPCSIREERGLRNKRIQKATVTTIKEERTVKAKYSISIMVAAVVMLAFSVPMPAFSVMNEEDDEETTMINKRG